MRPGRSWRRSSGSCRRRWGSARSRPTIRRTVPATPAARPSATAPITRARSGRGSSDRSWKHGFAPRATRRRCARRSGRRAWTPFSATSTRPDWATCRRWRTAIRPTRRAAARSRRGRWVSCSASLRCSTRNPSRGPARGGPGGGRRPAQLAGVRVRGLGARGLHGVGVPARRRHAVPRRIARRAPYLVPPRAPARRHARSRSRHLGRAGRAGLARPAGARMTGHYDVIIIGSGAGGGTLFHRLAPSGKRILLLERGDYVPPEKDNWNPRAVNVEGKYNTREQWYDRAGKPLHPHTNYYVGGNTKFFGSALFRLRREDFGEIRHHGGISPAWPIGYDDLEPHYSEAERLYPVHGIPAASRPGAPAGATPSSRTTARRSGSTTCTAPGARTPPIRARRHPIPIPRCATSRRSS